MTSRRRWGAVAARLAAALLLAALALGAFVLTRPEEDPPPATTTTTTFPLDAYVSAMSSALQARSAVPLDEPSARCIAEALLTVLGPEALHDLTDEPDPLAALTPRQREQALRIVVTCVDPAVAAELLGGGAAPVTPGGVTLPDEEG